MSKFIVTLLCITSLALFIGSADASVVYRWKDDKGIVHYSPQKPWGVKFEEIDTAFSANQREEIEKIYKEKKKEEYLANKEKLDAQSEKEKKERKVRLELCIDSAFDKIDYQKRRIEDDSIKEKLNCEYSYNKVKQKVKYDNCILQIESKRIKELKGINKVAVECFDSDTPPEVIEMLVEEYRIKHDQKKKNK